MDTADFLLEREDLLKRMEERRLQTTQEALSIRSGFIPWLLMAGAGVVSGYRSSQMARRLVHTLVWTAVAPMVLGVINRHDGGLIHRLFEAAFPSSHPKESIQK